MTFSYDEADDFDETDDFNEADDETDDFNEADNFDEEPQDAFLAEDDDDDSDTALSQAFRQATAGTMIDEDEADEDTNVDDAEEDNTEENEGADAKVYEQEFIKPVEFIDPVEMLLGEDENDLDLELPPLELPPMQPIVEPFRPQEQSNYAYADAVTAYYEENNYQRAIEKFNEAIEYEVQSAEGSLTDANEIVAKSKYWQAEAYVKLQDLPQAIGTFEDLVETCQAHYLSLAAQRRADELNAKYS